MPSIEAGASASGESPGDAGSEAALVPEVAPVGTAAADPSVPPDCGGADFSLTEVMCNPLCQVPKDDPIVNDSPENHGDFGIERFEIDVGKEHIRVKSMRSVVVPARLVNRTHDRAVMVTSPDLFTLVWFDGELAGGPPRAAASPAVLHTELAPAAAQPACNSGAWSRIWFAPGGVGRAMVRLTASTTVSRPDSARVGDPLAPFPRPVTKPLEPGTYTLRFRNRLTGQELHMKDAAAARLIVEP